jgi:hypothetical protein
VNSANHSTERDDGSLKQWLKRTCICPHPDRYECARIRENRQREYHPGLGEHWDDEPCDCCCHDFDPEEE